MSQIILNCRQLLNIPNENPLIARRVSNEYTVQFVFPCSKGQCEGLSPEAHMMSLLCVFLRDGEAPGSNIVLEDLFTDEFCELLQQQLT